MHITRIDTQFRQHFHVDLGLDFFSGVDADFASQRGIHPHASHLRRNLRSRLRWAVLPVFVYGFANGTWFECRAPVEFLVAVATVQNDGLQAH